MDSESVIAADGVDSAVTNGTLENSEGCSRQYPMETSEGLDSEQVDDDSKQMKGHKVKAKVKHEKPSVGKNVPSVLVKKKKYGKVVASNGSVAPNAQPVKSPKSKSVNGKEAHVTKVMPF